MTHGAAVAGVLYGGGGSATEGRADDVIADDPSALARAHHATVVHGRPLIAVVEQFAFVEAARRLRDLVVVLPVEHVARAQRRLAGPVRCAHGRRRYRQTRRRYPDLHRSIHFC